MGQQYRHTKIIKMRYIYLLKDPVSKEVVWIGETSKPKQRYDQHVWGCKKDSNAKKEWLNNLKAMGLKPWFEIVDTAENKRQAMVKENDIIVTHLKRGANLFNQRNSATLKQYDREGNLINEFANTIVARQITGIIPRTDRQTAGRFHWSYK